MFKSGRMVAIGLGSLMVLLATGIYCDKAESQWQERSSYIVTTDTVSVIRVLDDTGMVIAAITPLEDSMQGIWSPTLVGKSEQIAFLSRLKPGYPPYLFITDRSAKELQVHEIASPECLDGSPVNPELIYTLAGKGQTISFLETGEEDATPRKLFTDTLVQCDAIEGTLSLEQTMAPSFSPSGDKVAFVNVGWWYVDPETKIRESRTDLAVVNRDGTGYALITGALDDALPMASWMGTCWSYDGQWVFVIKGSQTIETIYVIGVDGENKGSRFAFTRDNFESYNFVAASPNGDTLMLGTKNPHADLYVLEFRFESAEFKLGYELTRLTDGDVYGEPDWGPGDQ